LPRTARSHEHATISGILAFEGGRRWQQSDLEIYYLPTNPEKFIVNDIAAPVESGPRQPGQY